eukprot:8556605-Alexandrium_andersonii.AAC.1
MDDAASVQSFAFTDAEAYLALGGDLSKATATGGTEPQPPAPAKPADGPGDPAPKRRAGGGRPAASKELAGRCH